jgi:hypothetical protein
MVEGVDTQVNLVRLRSNTVLVRNGALQWDKS